MTEPRDIIALAWAITKKERKLRHWGYASAFLSTLLSVKLLSYQIWFFISYLEGDPIGFFGVEEFLWQRIPHAVFITIASIVLIMVVIEFFFPHFATGAVIGLGAKSYRKEDVRGGLVLSIYNFFPIFVIHELFVLGSISTVITVVSLVLRYGGEGDFKWFIITVIAVAWVLSNIFHFFIIFAEEAIVVHKLGPFVALGRSFKLVISYLGHVFFLLLLIFIITLRIFLNVLMVFFIPALIIGLGALLTLFLPPIASYSIAGGFGILLIVLASYLFAYLDVFRQTVWTITYMQLSEMKDLDVIG